MILKDNNLINVGEAYIVVNIITGSLMAQDQDLQQHLAQGRDSGSSAQSLHLDPGLDINADDPSVKLKLKIFGGPSAGEIYYFKPDLSQRKIVIGRTPDCDIRINDKLLSKNQASISFAGEKSAWILTDGINNKASTNGTWLYLNENFVMHDGMIFKANQTIFQVSLKSGRLSVRPQ